MPRISIRPAGPSDAPTLGRLMHDLWPDGTAAEHEEESRAKIDAPVSMLPLALFVAEDASGVIGFVEVGLRSHADGCDPSRAVGFLEGWYVVAEHRKSGVGRALVARAESWCRERGCREIASDTWIDEEVSIAAHQALGFEIVDRCVHFRKALF